MQFAAFTAYLSLLLSAVDFLILAFISWRLMSTPPVTQATFDAALVELNTAFTTLLTSQQNIITGLSAVEAALVAAQQNPGSTDFSGELATVQNLQAEAAQAQANAQAAIASLPTPPPAPPTT